MRSRHGPGAAGHTGHCPQPAHTGLGSNPTAGQSESAVGLHLRNPSLMDYYSFNRPRRDSRLSRPFWLTDSGRFTHKEVTRPAASLAQDRESTPAEPADLTTMPRHQLNVIIITIMMMMMMMIIIIIIIITL